MTASASLPRILLAGIFIVLIASFAFASDDPASPPESNVDPERMQRQAQRVMNAGLPFAEKMLAEHSEFAPFGAVMLPQGLIQTVGANDRREEVPTEEIYEQLQDGLREGAAEQSYIAIATFVMVELRDPRSGEMLTAVHVALEHQDGYCVDVFYPTLLRGEILVLGDSFAGKRDGAFFDSCL
jgi:hypothetical protein